MRNISGTLINLMSLIKGHPGARWSKNIAAPIFPGHRARSTVFTVADWPYLPSLSESLRADREIGNPYWRLILETGTRIVCPQEWVQNIPEVNATQSSPELGSGDCVANYYSH